MSERVVCKYSSVAAPTKINAILIISEGCIEKFPIKIQFLAPCISFASISVITKTIRATIATGRLSFMTLSISARIHKSKMKVVIPARIAMN